jgi:hypothetical protein
VRRAHSAVSATNTERRRRIRLPSRPAPPPRQPQRRHTCLFVIDMLSAPDGFSGGNGAGLGAGGSSLWRIVRRFLMRGDRGKRSAAIVSRGSAAIAARSSGERSGCMPRNMRRKRNEYELVATPPWDAYQRD